MSFSGSNRSGSGGDSSGNDAIGAKTDPAANSDTADTGLISLIKRLLTKIPALINNRLPVNLPTGANTASNSTPVTLSSDGTFTQNFGLTTDPSATSDSGNFGFISLFKRLLERLTFLLAQIVLSDTISRTSTVLHTASVALLDNGTNLVRARSAVGSSEGLGRQKVAIGTFAYNCLFFSSGTSSLISLDSCYSKFGMQLSITSGSLSTVSYELQGSMDGTKWSSLVNSSATADGNIVFATDKPVLYFRVAVSMSGASPNLAIRICAC
jgi:hypothetical protein